MSLDQCFLCGTRSKSENRRFKNIETCTVPASQKTLQVVLQHLANCIKTKLVFRSEALICSHCFKDLSDYDNLMINLLSFQKKLTQQLQATITNNIEAEFDLDNVEMVIDGEAHLADAFNPELDVKEELIEIHDDDDSYPDEPAYIPDEEGDVEDEAELNRTRRLYRQECVVCGLGFKTKVQLQGHINEVHNTKVYNCNICGATRKDEEYLELHMNIHKGFAENDCRYCNKSFSRPVNALRHMRKHWDKKKYQCEKCGERFSLDNMLYNHRLRHEAEENPIICSICNQSFRSRKTYTHHMLIHQKDRPRYHCTLCSKSFTERYTLKMHMKTHQANNRLETQMEEAVTDIPNDLSCVICNTNFDNKDILEQHLQTSHDVILK